MLITLFPMHMLHENNVAIYLNKISRIFLENRIMHFILNITTTKQNKNYASKKYVNYTVTLQFIQ